MQEINTTLQRQKKQNLWIYSLHSISVYMDYQCYSNNNNKYNSNNVPVDLISLVKCFPLLFEFLLYSQLVIMVMLLKLGLEFSLERLHVYTKTYSLYIT